MEEEGSLRHWAISFFPSLRTNHPAYPWLVLLTVMLGTFMVVLDGTIVNVAIPSIMASFGVTVGEVVWISTAYLIALSVLLSTAGWIANHFGKKQAYLAGLFIFTLSSYLCGIAWNLHALVFFRVLQGVGGGILMPVGMTLFTDEFPPKQRAVSLGFYSIAVAAAISLGPSFGGYLIQKINWGWIFFINVPFGLLTALAAILILKSCWGKTIERFDWAGVFSLTVFLVTLIMGISSGNAAWNAEGWTSTYTLFCFFLSALFFALFIYVELANSHPIVDLTTFCDRNFLLGNLVLFIFSFTLFGSSFLLPLYFQNGLGYSTYETGLMLLPIGLTQGLFAGFTGWITKKIPTRFVIFAGIVLLGITYHFNAHFSLYTEKESIFWIFAFRGLAMALLFAPLVSLTLSTMPEEKMLQATGLFSVQRQIGAVLGVAVFETIFITRKVYHSAMFGSVIREDSPAFAKVKVELAHEAYSRVGSGFFKGALQAQELILSQIENHVFIQAIADNLLIAGGITFFSCIPLFFLKKPTGPIRSFFD